MLKQKNVQKHLRYHINLKVEMGSYKLLVPEILLESALSSSLTKYSINYDDP